MSIIFFFLLYVCDPLTLFGSGKTLMGTQEEVEHEGHSTVVIISDRTL